MTIPHLWHPIQGRLTGEGQIPGVARDTWIYARGRFGDVYGPLPFEMFSEEAWRGNMLHASHDLVGWALAPADRNPKGGNEVPSRSDESAIGEGEAPNPGPHHD